MFSTIACLICFFVCFLFSFGLFVRILADASGARSRGWYNSWLTNYSTSGIARNTRQKPTRSPKGKKKKQQQQQDKRRQKTSLFERIFVHILA